MVRTSVRLASARPDQAKYIFFCKTCQFRSIQRTPWKSVSSARGNMRPLLLLAAAGLACAQWDIPEDVPLGTARVGYQRHRDVWVVTFDSGAPVKYTYLIPQVCRADGCSVGQIAFPHLTCASVNTLLLDPAWYNENAASDVVRAEHCPRSFANPFDAQVLVGSVCPEPFVYVSVPTTLTIHNNETLLARFDRGGGDGEWRLAVRLLFLTEMRIGDEAIFSVRRYVAELVLTKPGVTSAVIAVQSSCAALGLRAPRYAQLHVRAAADGAAVCVWECRVDAMRSPWNAAPTETGAGECRPLAKYFTAVEFALTVDTDLRGVVPARLSPFFLTEIDAFAARLEAALAAAAPGSLVALTLPGSDFDTAEWLGWMREFIAFSHRGDAVAASNGSLVVEALRTVGVYTEVVNPAFLYSLRAGQRARQRRFAVQDLVLKGLWFSPDVTTNVRAMWSRLQDLASREPHEFSPLMQVQRVAHVDVARVHRVAPLYTNESAAEEQMQRSAAHAVEGLCLLALFMACCMRRCSRGRDDAFFYRHKS
jgi:hypothetical protein